MSTSEEDVQTIAKNLEKMIAGKKEMDNALDLIEALGKLPMTVDILSKTRIGMTINELRKKTNDEALSKRAKALIRDWKTLLAAKAASSKSSRKVDDERKAALQRRPPDGDGGGDDGSPDTADASTPSSQQSSSSLTLDNNSKTSVFAQYAHNKKNPDEARQKCVEMLESALRIMDLPDGTHDPRVLAVRIETKVFETHGRHVNDKYRAAVRSRIFNLRDKKNLALRENILTGALAAEKFATMTADEMASDEMKKMRQQFTQDAIKEHQMAVQEGTPSDMFRCGKCGKNNCTYTQVQTRSADEPMTTFVFCRECGNRWKFC